MNFYPFVNIHHHGSFVENENCICVVNVMVGEAFVPQNNNVFFSYGIHPWQLEKSDKKMLISTFEKAVNTKKIVAIGEIGIDKTRPIPIDLQLEIFRLQVHVAEEFQLPIILHSVKGIEEILRVKKEVKTSIPWILHGFNGTKESVDQLSKFDFYFSVGSSIKNDSGTHTQKIIKSLKHIPLNRLFLETDVSKTPIEVIYAKIADTFEINLETLKKIIFENYLHCFKLSDTLLIND